MATTVPREVRVLKVNQDLPDSKATLVPRVSRGHKVPSDPQELTVRPVNQVSLESRDQTGPRATQARRAPLERKETRVQQGHKVPLVIPVLGASRVPTVFVV